MSALLPELPASVLAALADLAQGEPGAAVRLVRDVRAGGMGHGAEARVTEALFFAQTGFTNPRLRLAVASLCQRVGEDERALGILRQLVAADYPPAWHAYGCLQIEAGEVQSGLRLLKLARESGFAMGESQYWRYQAELARWPRRGWLYLRMWVARLRPPPAAPGEDDAVWLREKGAP